MRKVDVQTVASGCRRLHLGLIAPRLPPSNIDFAGGAAANGRARPSATPPRQKTVRVAEKRRRRAGRRRRTRARRARPRRAARASRPRLRSISGQTPAARTSSKSHCSTERRPFFTADQSLSNSSVSLSLARCFGRCFLPPLFQISVPESSQFSALLAVIPALPQMAMGQPKIEPPPPQSPPPQPPPHPP